MPHSQPSTLSHQIVEWEDILFYTVDDIEKPVAFISSSLTASQLWWFIVQKEAFGIFYFRKILSVIKRTSTYKYVHIYVHRVWYEAALESCPTICIGLPLQYVT